jgi:hypothetical protein
MTGNEFSDALESAADKYYEENFYKAPTWEASRYESEPLWSEVLPGLWQGGTHDNDVVWYGGKGTKVGVTRADFEFVTTLYADANPVDWFVEEVRFGIYDSDVEHIDKARLFRIVKQTHDAWKNGDKVLIRCQAGWNRSGLVTALVLMRDGMPAHEAIQLIREKRSPFALCNSAFEAWLLAMDTAIVKN